MWVETWTRRWVGALLTLLPCVACGDTTSRPEVRSPIPVHSPAAEAPAPSLLSSLPRPGRAGDAVRIVAPGENAVLDAELARTLAVVVEGPQATADRSVSLVLSLDGARPRPVTPGSIPAVSLLDPGSTLGPGAHDLVLAAVRADGVVLEGALASLRFFVGARPSTPTPPRVVCLAPFGTFYGNEPAFVLDFAIVPGGARAVDVTGARAGGERVRAEGPGPFGLGAFGPGDHELTLSLTGDAQALTGRCVFTVNPELERSR